MKKEKEATTFYCPKDRWNEHYWQSIGVLHYYTINIFQVFKCTQCKKIKVEPLERVKEVSKKKKAVSK